MRLTDLLAIYGAGLATFTACWNFARSRGQVRVQLIFALETINGESKHGVGISVQNTSAQTVHVNSVSLLYPFAPSTWKSRLKHLLTTRQIPRSDGWCHIILSYHGVDHKCPVAIEPGQAHYIFVDGSVLDLLLKDARSPLIKGLAQDALWRRSYSKAFEWL